MQNVSEYIPLLIVLQVLSCAFMTGLIWTIQVLHYPAFAYVDEGRFKKFHGFHSRNITFIVLPVMAIELLTAGALAFGALGTTLVWVNFIGVLLIWLSTFVVTVPLHNSLAAESDAKIIQRLVGTNWIRTLLWSARLILLGFFIFQLLEAKIVLCSSGSAT